VSAAVVLAAVAAASYLWRAIAVALSPEAIRAIDHLLGKPNEYAPDVVLVVGSLVGLCSGMMLLFGAMASLGGKHRTPNAALVFTAGLSLPGFLQALDLIFGLQGSRNVEYVIQEAVAFMVCATALALTGHWQRAQMLRA
jgi:hypothetical protein